MEECLEGLAWVAAGLGRHPRAARLFGAAEGQRAVLGHRSAPQETVHHDEAVAATRAALGDAGFHAAWAEGRALTLEQAIAYALAGDAD